LVEHRSALNKPKLECKQSSNRKIELVATKFICTSDSHSFLLPASKHQTCRPYGFLVRFCGSLLVCHVKYLWKTICGDLSVCHHSVNFDFGTRPTSHQWVSEAPFLGVKRPGRKAGHLHVVSGLRICLALSPFPPYVSLALFPVKTRGSNFISQRSQYHRITTVQLCVHSFSILYDDRFKASSKTIPPHKAI